MPRRVGALADPDVDDEGPAPEAGWRPDPFGRRARRWWDGTAWTAYAGDGDDTTWDPSPLEPTVERPPGLPGIGVAVAGYVIGVGLSFGVTRTLAPEGDDGNVALVLALGALALWTGLVGACVAVARRRGSGSLVTDFAFRFRWIDLGFGLAGSLVGRMAAGLAVSPIPLPARRLDDLDKAGLDAPHGPVAWVVLVVVVCVGAPLVEELFFRGLLQTRLVGRAGPVAGIVVASVLFGAAHLIAWDGPLSLANAWAIAAAGLVLGLLRHATGRLGPGIVAHALFNVQAILALAFLT